MDYQVNTKNIPSAKRSFHGKKLQYQDNVVEQVILPPTTTYLTADSAWKTAGTSKSRDGQKRQVERYPIYLPNSNTLCIHSFSRPSSLWRQSFFCSFEKQILPEVLSVVSDQVSLVENFKLISSLTHCYSDKSLFQVMLLCFSSAMKNKIERER